MNVQLIENCYKNKYGIDLKQFHKGQCPTIEENEYELINAINHDCRIIFNDGRSRNLKLVIHDELIYLIGENSCYPCSTVVETVMGKQFNWVRCYVVPDGHQILGETDIRKSAIIVSVYSELISLINDESTLMGFLNDIRFTFENCEWFKAVDSLSLYIRLTSVWNYKEKIYKLYENGLLYPLEMVLFNLYKKVGFKTELFIQHFIKSLAESTNKIFKCDEICDFLNTLSLKQLEAVFGIELIRESVRLDILDDDYFADLLELDGRERYSEFVNGQYWLYHLRARADSIFLVPNFRRNYLKQLRVNFRGLENELRQSKGFKNVGTFFMEKLLYNRLRDLFPALNIQAQFSPKWLFPQRFDIFIVECDLAIEYNGPQHYKAIDFFGGKDGLMGVQLLDKTKKEKCIAHSIKLYEIRYDEDFDLAVDELKKIIGSRIF